MKAGETLQTEIRKAMEDKELPSIYFNGFSITIGTGDVVLILKRNDRPVAILNTSHTVGKTVATKLGSIVAMFEQKMGNTIMTTDEIQAKLTGEHQT